MKSKYHKSADLFSSSLRVTLSKEHQFNGAGSNLENHVKQPRKLSFCQAPDMRLDEAHKPFAGGACRAHILPSASYPREQPLPLQTFSPMTGIHVVELLCAT